MHQRRAKDVKSIKNLGFSQCSQIYSSHPQDKPRIHPSKDNHNTTAGRQIPYICVARWYKTVYLVPPSKKHYRWCPLHLLKCYCPLSGYIFSFNVWKSVCIRFDYTTKTLYYFPVMHIKSFRVIYVGHCNSKIYLTIIDKRFSVKQISSWPNNRKWRLYMQILPGAILLTQKRGNQVKGSLSGVHSMQNCLVYRYF